MKKCIKCNSEITDESIFCPYCGSKQEVISDKGNANSKKKQKNTKNNKKIAVVLLVLGLIVGIGFVAYDYSKKIGEYQAFEEQIAKDYFTEADGIEGKIKAKISYKVTQIKDDQFTVQVSYVDVSEGLLTYVENSEEFSEEGLLNEIERLLIESEKISEEYTLTYEKDEEMIKIAYILEINDAFTCGLTKFYRISMEEMLEEN